MTAKPLTFNDLLDDVAPTRKLFAGRTLRRFEPDAKKCGCTHSCGCERPVEANPGNADLVCSDGAGWGERHMPVIDLDVPATLVPSATPGHSHLYIDVKISPQRYWKLLDALVDAGIVEHGYVEAARERGYTAVRVPWKPKAVPPRTFAVDGAGVAVEVWA